MKRIVIAMVGFLALCAITPAHATTWYILTALTATCDLASNKPSSLWSPYALETDLRRRGEYHDTVVVRYDNGTIRGVIVFNNRDRGILFFNGMAACRAARLRSLANGTITDPGELK